MKFVGDVTSKISVKQLAGKGAFQEQIHKTREDNEGARFFHFD